MNKIHNRKTIVCGKWLARLSCFFPCGQYLSDDQRAVFAGRRACVALAFIVDNHGFHWLGLSVTQPGWTAGERKSYSTQTHSALAAFTKWWSSSTLVVTQEHNLFFYVTVSMQSIKPGMGLCTYTALESSGPEVDSSPASWSTSSSSSSSVVSESSLDEE